MKNSNVQTYTKSTNRKKDSKRLKISLVASNIILSRQICHNPQRIHAFPIRRSRNWEIPMCYPQIEKRLKKMKDFTGCIPEPYYPKQANLPHQMLIQPFPNRISKKWEISMQKQKRNTQIQKRLKKMKDCTASFRYSPKQANLPHRMLIRPLPNRISKK